MSTASATVSHALHTLATGNGQYACAPCHNGMVPPAQEQNHGNGSVDLSFSTPPHLTAPMVQSAAYSAGFSFGVGTPYGSCSNSYCHGTCASSSGANTARVSCEKCHGSATT